MSERQIIATRQKGRTLARQHGVVVPIVAIGLLALLAVAGLAVDASHALANKTRMQNTVDAAALAAAKVLDLTEDTAAAETAARNIFDINALGDGNHELADACIGKDCIEVQFSATVSPFTPGSSDGPFVRVLATGFDTQTTLSRVLGINEIPTPATAVAGPSGPLGIGPKSQLCNVAPIAVCPPAGGWKTDELEVLKPLPGGHDAIGPGNYKLLDLDCGQGGGGNCIAKNMAGDNRICLTNGETYKVDTKPGQTSGPMFKGFNTRFDEFQGRGFGLNRDDHPPDRHISEQDPFKLRACTDDAQSPPLDRIYKITGDGGNFCQHYDPNDEHWKKDEVETGSEVPYNYSDYLKDSKDPKAGLSYGKNFRRRLVFPTISCTGEDAGTTEVTVDGFVCFFMLQALDVGNVGQGGGQIFGELVDTCQAKGTGSTTSGTSDPLLYKIQLYKDPDSGDS